ncbi:MAG TPA: SPOR domain-containing protein [Candidatus Eisenbacteria bacterium]|nr:SPOR domain-containing protein [Candidatus Eisenbacteria bacterium]
MRAISDRIAASVVLAALALGGCASQRAPAPRSEPPSAPSASGSSAPGAGSPDAGSASGAVIDPSEEITAEELATIPEPVPGETTEAPIEPAPPPRDSPSQTQPPPGDDGAARTAWIWRVQIFASPDRTQAERTAREASEQLGAPHVIDREGSLYKVRLGAFSKESDAEPLKRRAVLEGYTGAFRVRTVAP